MMTNNFATLYQETILKYFKNQDYVGLLPPPCSCKKGKNRMCGDSITISYRNSALGAFDAIRFEVEGCAILKASATLMVKFLQGKTMQEAHHLFCELKNIMEKQEGPIRHFEELNIFMEIHKYPSRMQCALLPWKTLLEDS